MVILLLVLALGLADLCVQGQPALYSMFLVRWGDIVRGWLWTQQNDATLSPCLPKNLEHFHTFCSYFRNEINFSLKKQKKLPEQWHKPVTSAFVSGNKRIRNSRSFFATYQVQGKPKERKKKVILIWFLFTSIHHFGSPSLSSSLLSKTLFLFCVFFPM